MLSHPFLRSDEEMKLLCERGIQRHAPYPPHSLIAGLRREVESYDQVCDAIESHIVCARSDWLSPSSYPRKQTQAISSLKRDVEIEERRIKDAQNAALEIRARSKSESISPASARLPPPIIHEGTVDVSIDPSSSKTLTQSQVKAVSAASLPSIRRQSAISISSLQRPVLPHKLDLSMASFRFEEASIFTSGIASPVTLAPKSARPLDYPPDLMVPFTGTEAANQGVGIDLDIAAVEASTSATTADQMSISLDPSVDDGAGDKSITLDLGAFSMPNMSDFFGDPTEANSNDPDGAKLFAPSTSGPETFVPDLAGNKMDTTVHALGTETPGTFTGETDDLFASIDASAASTAQYLDQTDPSQLSSMPPRSIGLSPSVVADTSPSPSSILASLTSDGAHTTSTTHALHASPSGDASFELSTLDLEQLSNGFYQGAKNNDEDIMMMEEFLDMDKKDHLSPNEMS
jgi:hypothetical protein